VESPSSDTSEPLRKGVRYSSCWPMEIVKIPKMEKAEYDALISDGYVSRIAFCGDKYPYIAPFLYVFDGNFMYFLSTRYGKKIKYFRSNPYVSVEVERYSQDLSCYMFVTLQGRLEEVEDAIEKKMVREKFIGMIRKKRLSKNILAALGTSPRSPWRPSPPRSGPSSGASPASPISSRSRICKGDRHTMGTSVPEPAPGIDAPPEHGRTP